MRPVGMLNHSFPKLREIVVGLNEILTEIYGMETRLSRLLSTLGFNELQIKEVREKHLREVVVSFVTSLEERVSSFQDGERAFMVVSRYYGLDGEPRETLQNLGEKLSITRERVRQIKVKILKKCKVKANREFLELQLKENVTLLLRQGKG